MRVLSIFLLTILCFGCRKKNTPQPPEAAALVFPANNSECTTGIDTNPTTSMVEFRWKMAELTDTYELRATHVATNTTQTVSTSGLSASLPLEKGAFYTWVVSTRNSSVLQAARSQTWRFYNAGFETTYAPFPAELSSPKPGETIFKDINNEVTLGWSGSDIDDDIESYAVYFGTEKPVTSVLATTSAARTVRKVTVMANTVYYWKVRTTDSEGNSSDSAVFDFKVN